VGPLVRNLIEKEGAGENKGGVGFAEVEFDSPTLGEVAGRYMVRTLPLCGRRGSFVCCSIQDLLGRVLIARGGTDYNYPHAPGHQSWRGAVADATYERCGDER